MIKAEAAGITVTQNNGDFFQAGMKSPLFPFKYIKKHFLILSVLIFITDVPKVIFCAIICPRT